MYFMPTIFFPAPVTNSAQKLDLLEYSKVLTFEGFFLTLSF